MSVSDTSAAGLSSSFKWPYCGWPHEAQAPGRLLVLLLHPLPGAHIFSCHFSSCDTQTLQHLVL